MPSFQTFGDSSEYNRVAENDDTEIDTPGILLHFEIDDDENDSEKVEEELVDLEKHPTKWHDSLSATSVSSLTTYVRQPPCNYFCPLTLHLMEDPVLDGCGHCFDRDAISSWLHYHSFCPISRKPLRSSDLLSATTLQERIQHWKEGHRSFSSEPDTLLVSDTGSYPQLDLMLLPQERKVLSLIKIRKQIRTKREAHARCLWVVVGVLTLCAITIAFVAIYIYDVELRGPL